MYKNIILQHDSSLYSEVGMVYDTSKWTLVKRVGHALIYYSCVFGKRNYRVLVRVSVCVCVCVFVR